MSHSAPPLHQYLEEISFCTVGHTVLWAEGCFGSALEVKTNRL